MPVAGLSAYALGDADASINAIVKAFAVTTAKCFNRVEAKFFDTVCI